MTMAMRKSNQPRSVGRILSGQAHLSVLRLTEAWPDVVGPAAAGHCRPASFAKGRLVVSADSSAWANELDFLAAEIMPRLEALLGVGVVREIKFKTASRRRGLKAPLRAEEPIRPPTREPAPGETARIRAETEAIKDPELRDQILKLRLKAARHPAPSFPPTNPGRSPRSK